MSLLSDFRPATGGTTEKWTRPSDWLTITKPGLTEEKIILLCAVFADGDNLLALKLGVASGTYTVDWGDGSSPTEHTSGTVAERNLDYSGISAATESTLGYRQCIVTVTPTTPGVLFAFTSNVPLIYRPTSWATANVGYSPVLEVYLSTLSTNLYATLDGGNTPVAPKSSLLEYVYTNGPNCTSYSYYLRGQISLQKTDFTTFPVSKTNFAQCFNSCNVLKEVTYNGGPFTTCFDRIVGGGLAGTFYECNNIDFGDVLEIPAEIWGATCLYGCLTACSELKITGTTSSVAAIYQGLVYNHQKLRKVTIFNATTSQNALTMTFQNARGLREIVILGDLGSVASQSNLFVNLFSLRKVILTNLRISFSIANNRLSATALNDLFTSLGTANGAQTVTITGNPGAATCDTSIATAKGWTVTA